MEDDVILYLCLCPMLKSSNVDQRAMKDRVAPQQSHLVTWAQSAVLSRAAAHTCVLQATAMVISTCYRFTSSHIADNAPCGTTSVDAAKLAVHVLQCH